MFDVLDSKNWRTHCVSVDESAFRCVSEHPLFCDEMNSVLNKETKLEVRP